MAEINVTQVRSGIGRKPKQRGTLRALGLGRIGRSNVLPDRPEIRGMVAKVPHLVSVVELSSTTEPEGARRRRSPNASPDRPAEPDRSATEGGSAEPPPSGPQTVDDEVDDESS